MPRITEDDDEEERPVKKKGGRGPQSPRISLTLPLRIRRKIRIAAAKADMDDPEWCRAILVAAANKTVAKLNLDD